MHFRVINFALFLVLAGLLTMMGQPQVPEMPVSVTAFSATRGEALLIEGPETNILIDSTGGPGIVPRVADEIEGGAIDLFMITHPHSDHIGGAQAILSQLTVGEVWITGVQYDSKGYSSLLREISGRNTQFITAQSDAKVGNFTVDILHPQESLRGATYPNGDINDTSIVARISYGDFDLLSTGDVSKSIESSILAELSSSIEVLKVAHQGSYTSTSQAFLSKIQPEIAVIGVGSDNPYGHPHSRVISRLEAAGAYIFRTDLNGKIKMLTDGTKIFVIPERVKEKLETS